MKYFLDTNSLWHLLDSIAKNSELPLQTMLKNNDEYLFTISEITSLEIYSVVGKMGRGSLEQKNSCDRLVKNLGEYKECGMEWYVRSKKKIATILLQGYHKLIRDMEPQRGLLNAQVVKLDSTLIEISRKLLTQYSNHYELQSLDSLVAASFVSLQGNEPWTIVTSDKKLKNILKLESYTIYDPLKDYTS